MATKNLKTDWKTIGRSGKTTDGRTITPEMLLQAAKNYSKELFTALIWPEHLRWFNMGQVDQLRVIDNSEGGKDLQAILAPNGYYFAANDAGQKLFTSMELLPDFRGTKEWYLTGLGATDDPASAGTSQIQFSATNKDAVLSEPVEVQFFAKEQKPSFTERMAKLFSSSTNEDPDMSGKAELEALQQQFAAMKTELQALKSSGKTDDKKPEEKPDSLDAKFSALEAKFDDLLTKFSASTTDKGDDSAKKLADMETKFAALSQKLEDALKEAPGTQTKENKGEGAELKSYL